MKIAIEARAVSGSGSGVRTYTLELIRHLLQLGRDDYTLLYGSKQPVGTFTQAHEEIVPLHHEALLPLWLHHLVPDALERLKPDVIHFTKADVPKKKRVATVVTIYDVIPLLLPQTQSWSRRLYWPRALQRAAQLSDHIMTISERSKQDIIELLQVDPSRITVTPLAINREHFQPVDDAAKLANVRAKYNLPEHYMLFLGTRDIRKNIGALIRAYAKIHQQIPNHLVIAGKPALKQDTSGALISSLGFQDKVHMLGSVAYDDLPALYSAADLFVWPTVYEGWAFPPQEAMACGTPVIVSDGGPLPEVVGNAGEIVQFSETDLMKRLSDDVFISRLAERIEQVLSDPVKQKHMTEAGLQRVQQFSWQSVAKKTRSVYEMLNVNQSAPRSPKGEVG